MLIGEPYQINGTTYRPSDALNYDHVGYAALDSVGGTAISAAHHTLPVPSYAEVTSLDSGRTILVRVERRGPMEGNDLIALSAGAFDQLGAQPGVAVRVRRVNPPEDQRALLRSGQQAPLRMDTPKSLIEVLRRRLPQNGSASLQASVEKTPAGSQPSPSEQNAVAPERSASVATNKSTTSATNPPPLPPVAERRAHPDPAEPVGSSKEGRHFAEAFPAEKSETAAQNIPAPRQPVQKDAGGHFMVQAATFSTQERAQKASEPLQAHVTPSGRYYLMQMGPFRSRAEAQASLAKVKAAGYSDARIFTLSK
ncbi:SPOR domain-containing protein [Altericroceibacterium spongiae]|nr:SPOR domain-containing protein [Altericroceibacterium spongiae]